MARKLSNAAPFETFGTLGNERKHTPKRLLLLDIHDSNPLEKLLFGVRKFSQKYKFSENVTSFFVISIFLAILCFNCYYVGKVNYSS